MIIGRTPDNDLQIDSRFVSRHHCQIITKANACVVEDLNSTNGIVVKSRRVRNHNLNDGDVITIGRHDLIYVDERGGGRSGLSDSHRTLVAPSGMPARSPRAERIPPPITAKRRCCESRGGVQPPRRPLNCVTACTAAPRMSP